MNIFQFERKHNWFGEYVCVLGDDGDKKELRADHNNLKMSNDDGDGNSCSTTYTHTHKW